MAVQPDEENVRPKSDNLLMLFMLGLEWGRIGRRERGRIGFGKWSSSGAYNTLDFKLTMNSLEVKFIG